MRRTINIAVVIAGVWAVMTGVWQFFPPLNKGTEPYHAIPAFCFAILLAIHVWLNRKPLLRYFKGLGWWWILIGLGFLLILGTGIMPIFF